MSVFRVPLVVFVLLAACACTQMRESEPGRTATEQLLFSAAAERACDALAVRIPEGSKVFVDPGYVEGTDSKYLIATLRDRILSHGGKLVAARDTADLVIEPRLGADSVDRKATLVGIPQFPVPIPLAGNLNFPELALFKRDRQQGVIKLALTSYDARTGELRQSLEPVYGYSQRTEWVVLLFFSWQDNDLVPDPDNDPWVGESTFELSPSDEEKR
ncbi:MAG: DUF6655 family protein [Alphaproteobacteria bacterium]